MTTFYVNMAKTASRLLKRFGQDVTISHTGSPGYDPSVGAATPAVVSSFTCKGAVLDYERINYGETLANGSLVQASDRKLLLETKNGRPQLDDHALLADGNIVTIVEVKALNPGAEDVMYDCRIRR